MIRTRKPPALKLSGLSKKFGKNFAVRDVNMEVKSGEIFGFLGPNGAGKTTTIRMILDLVRPTSGSVEVFGERPVNNPTLRRRIGYLTGDMEFYDNLSAKRYLSLVASLSGGIDPGKISRMTKLLDVNVDKKIKELSRGNKQKVGLLAAFARETDMLVLDEPTSGLDPLMQRKFELLVHEYCEQGGTVFISSHILDEVQHLCDRLAFIKDGELAATGTLRELTSGIRYKVELRGGVDVMEQLKKISGITSLRLNANSAKFYIADEPGPVLAKLPLKEIADIRIAPTELDELFTKYYESESEET